MDFYWAVDMNNIKKVIKAILYTILFLVCSMLCAMVTYVVIELLKMFIGVFAPFLMLAGVAIIFCVFIYKEIL